MGFCASLPSPSDSLSRSAFFGGPGSPPLPFNVLNLFFRGRRARRGSPSSVPWEHAAHRHYEGLLGQPFFVLLHFCSFFFFPVNTGLLFRQEVDCLITYAFFAFAQPVLLPGEGRFFSFFSGEGLLSKTLSPKRIIFAENKTPRGIDLEFPGLFDSQTCPRRFWGHLARGSFQSRYDPHTTTQKPQGLPF